MPDWVDRMYESTVGWDHIEDLVDIEGNGRLAGTASERTAADLTREAFEAVGARDVRFDEFDIQGWERESSSLVHPGTGTTHECFALHRSPRASVEGSLVDLGHGLPETIEERDIDGKVVLVTDGVPDDYHRGVPRLEKYFASVRHGAAGFVFRNHQPGCLIRSGTVRGFDDEIGEIPAVGVSYEGGARLARRFEDEPVSLTVEADIYDGTSRNVRGELGPATDEHLIVSCHLDSADISVDHAGDNAAGVGMVVELIKALAAREDELDTRIEFIGFGAETVGLRGSAFHAGKTDFDAVKAVVQNDGVVRASDLLVYYNGFDELGEIAVDTGKRFDEPVNLMADLALHSDQWNFVKHGVPGYQLSTETREGEPMKGLDSRLVMSPYDTFEKLDKRDLRGQAVWETELLVRLADESVSVPHRDPASIDAQLKREDADYPDYLWPVV